MSEKPDDGGPAFPLADGTRDDEGGMSLRDYFAGQALIAYASSDEENAARNAYRCADAMLRERAKS